MSGISEALVATAVGLMVAIPAVIAFNYFQGEGAQDRSARIDAIAHMVLSTFTPAEADTGGDAGPRRGEGLAHGRAALAATATTTTPVG